MPAVKTYTRVNFQNYPSTSTPLNATNLNKLDKGIDDLDDEVVTVKNAIENMSFDADSISYDNTSSGLQATDVQDAVDEINDNLTDGIGGTSDKFRFGTDGNGNYGYIKKVAGADTFFPFKMKMEIVSLTGDTYYRIVNIYNTYSDTNKGIFRNDLSTLSQPIQGEFVSITNNSGTYKYWTIKALRPCHVKLMKILDNSNVQDATVVSEANYTTNDIITSGTLLSSDDIYTLVITEPS